MPWSSPGLCGKASARSPPGATGEPATEWPSRLGFDAALRSARDSLCVGRRSVSATIELPVWLVGILAALALVAVLDRLLIPSVRLFSASAAQRGDRRAQQP